MKLFDRRILLVTGKGGVGKTTVAASLALHAANQGRRTLLVELAGSNRAPAIFGGPDGDYKARQLAPKLHGLRVTSQEAIEDYIVQQVKIKALYKLVFRNRIMGPFMDAVPGLHDLVQLGKVFDLERDTRLGRRSWDLIVVDAPATGHGLTMLASPRSMMELTRRGPIFDNAQQLHELFVDPRRTGIVLVSLPEEMPVNETLELHRRLGDYKDQVALAVLNEMHEAPFSHPERWPELRAHLEAPGLTEALRFTDRAVGRANRQQRALERLDALPCPLVQLPFLFRRDLRVEEIQELTGHLSAGLESP